MKHTDLTPHERERAYRYLFTQIEQDTETFLCNALERFHDNNYDCHYHIGLYPEILDRKPEKPFTTSGYVWFEIDTGEGKQQRLDLLAEAITEIGLIIKGF